jgi:hypothetical protein
MNPMAAENDTGREPRYCTSDCPHYPREYYGGNGTFETEALKQQIDTLEQHLGDLLTLVEAIAASMPVLLPDEEVKQNDRQAKRRRTNWQKT